jgi:hypothetical protein
METDLKAYQSSHKDSDLMFRFFFCFRLAVTSIFTGLKLRLKVSLPNSTLNVEPIRKNLNSRSRWIPKPIRTGHRSDHGPSLLPIYILSFVALSFGYVDIILR